jgi:hypothetical protein
MLTKDSNLQVVTLLRHLQSLHPVAFPDLRIRRTLERRIRQWRALNGPERDIIFRHSPEPSYMAQSDFVHAEDLGVIIAGQRLLICSITSSWSTEAGNISAWFWARRVTRHKTTNHRLHQDSVALVRRRLQRREQHESVFMT